MELERSIEELIAREIDMLGYELVKIESYFSGRRGILRIFIDRADAPVTIEDCVRLTKTLGLVLDGVDAMPGPYNLEISSPGMYRPLTKPAHFARFRGERARVTYSDEAGARATAIGEIADSSETAVVIAVEGATRTIPFERMLRANLQPDDGARRDPERPVRGRRKRRGKTL